MPRNPMSRAVGTVALASLLAMTAAGLSVGAPAAATSDDADAVPECAHQKLTGIEPRLGYLASDHDGSTLAALSFADPDGGNPDGNEELTVYDVATGTATRLSDTEDLSSWWIDEVSISADGSRVVASSNYDLVTGVFPPAEWNHDIFLYDVGSGTMTQISTPEPGLTGSDSSNARISADGSTVAYEGEQPQSGIYLMDVATKAVEPLDVGDDEPLYGLRPMPDADGSHVAYQSSTSILPGGGTYSEVFLAQDGVGVTPVADGSITLYGISDDGNRVLYQLGGESFVFDSGTGLSTKVSGPPGNGGFFDFGGLPSMDGAGDTVAFQSGRNLTGQNGDGSREVFVWDQGTHHQVTSSTNPLTPTGDTPEITGDGNRVIYPSRANLGGLNPAGVETWFLSCTGGAPAPPPPPPPTPKCDGKPVTVDLSKGQTPTNGNDVILGTNARNVVNGLNGNDRFCGRGGNDSFNGGGGSDRALGGGGNDTLKGGGGNDLLKGEGGKDTLLGEGGKDALNGGPQRDTCNGGPQRDTASACEVRKSIP